MATGTLYRAPQRDSNGDPRDQDGNLVHVGSDGTKIGTITGLVLGGPSWQPANGGTVDTTGLIGVPVSEAVQPLHGDLLAVDGIRYRIQGPPSWGSRGLVTTPPRYRWFTITAASN